MPASIQHVAADYLKAHDPILGKVVDTVGYPTFSAHTNYYETLVGSIISQQLSVKAADTIEKRFVALFNGPSFPLPEAIISKDIEELRAVGLSRQKASYIQDLAAKVIDGSVRFEHLDKLSNDEIIKELTAVKGIGVWTVHMFLMFCMGRLDVLPTGDLGIRNGIQKLYNLPSVPTPTDIETVAKEHHWHPYESIASWYIWQSLNNAPSLESAATDVV